MGLAESVGENLEKVNKAMEVEKMRRNGMIVLMGEELQQGKVPKAGLRFEQHNIPEIDVNREEELKRVLFNYLKPKEATMLAESVGENLEKVNKAMEVEKMRRNGMIVLMGEELQQ